MFAHIPNAVCAQTHNSFGVSDALPTIPDQNESNKLLSSIVYSMDRLSNPDTSTKPGTLGALRGNEEIWVLVARFFNNYHVALFPGVKGKRLSAGLKSMNDRHMPLYEPLDLPCGFSGRFCLGAAALTWGCRPGDPDYVMGEQDVISWAPNQFDAYSAPIDWALASRTRASAHIATWHINSQNMTRLFAAVYGSEHLADRMQTVEDLRSLNVRDPHKYTLPFVRNAWNALNHRWIQEIKEITNVLRQHARVGRPTYDQLKSIGMTIDPATNETISQRPDVFDVRDAHGYFQTAIVRKMNA